MDGFQTLLGSGAALLMCVSCALIAGLSRERREEGWTVWSEKGREHVNASQTTASIRSLHRFDHALIQKGRYGEGVEWSRERMLPRVLNAVDRRS